MLLVVCGIGRQESLERWEFCIQTTSKFFSYGLGSLYERSPARYRARLDNIRVVSCYFFVVGMINFCPSFIKEVLVT